MRQSDFSKIFLAFFMLCTLLYTGCKSLEDLGNEALQIGDYDRAMQKFSEALDASPANRNARYGMALACYGKAESAEKIGTHPIELWTKTESEFRILSHIDSTLAKEMHSSTLFYLARAKIAQNPQAKVLGILNESIALDSGNFFSLNLKALALQGIGEYDEAQKIFNEILSKNPNFAPAYSNLGNLYWELGKIEDAWDIWSLGSIQFPKNPHLKHWTKVAEDSLKILELQKEEARP